MGKLMVPLFYNGFFNRNERKMRAEFVREVTDGKQTFRLWCSAGKPDKEYTSLENDRYYLHVEVGGYLVPLPETEWSLILRCGQEPAAIKMHGSMEARNRWFENLRRTETLTVIQDALDAEQEEIRHYGENPAQQAEYIQKYLSDRRSSYLKARQENGQSFPDFIGALMADDLPRCIELSVIYRTKRQAEHDVAQAHKIEETKTRNKETEQEVMNAIQTLRFGGTLKNKTILFYRNPYESHEYHILNYLMQLYQIEVPIRTRGWINDKLISVSIGENGSIQVRYYKTRKKGLGSRKFFFCMAELICAVKESPTPPLSPPFLCQEKESLGQTSYTILKNEC